ncbi:MAG: low specificity L-threonine aldolase [Methylobacteriaceae bacterium]|nr:low specificity L-threonine aldolase [Methylobacteriaceae bacterium]
MHFGSDNIVGASQPVLDAILAANSGAEPSYGADSVKKRVDKMFCDLFERDVQVFLVATGTGANALCVSAMTPPWGMCISNEESHINGEETGAPELYTGGAKLMTLKGDKGRLLPDVLDAYVRNLSPGFYQMPAKSISVSQLNECGIAYTPDEIAALSDVAKKYRLWMHMDGARFANALVHRKVTPAEMTWKSGVDILSFGATKNGALAAEAIVVFRPELAEAMEYRRKRAGQTISKGRLLSSQFIGYLENDHWLSNARHANAMAAELKAGLEKIPGIRLPWEVEGNEVFPVMPRKVFKALKDAGAVFYEWPTRSVAAADKPGADETMARLVTSFQTTADEVAQFVDVAAKAA